MDNFSVRFKPLAASVSTNIVDYFKLVFAETETYSVPKHNLCVPKRKNFCAPLKAFNCAFKSYFLAPFKKMAPPWKTGWIRPCLHYIKYEFIFKLLLEIAGQLH